MAFWKSALRSKPKASFFIIAVELPSSSFILLRHHSHPESIEPFFWIFRLESPGDLIHSSWGFCDLKSNTDGIFSESNFHDPLSRELSNSFSLYEQMELSPLF